MKFPFREINIKIIPHGCQRYETYGDYFINERNGLEVRISEFDNPSHSLMVAIHEVIEAWRCAAKGIEFAEIDKFDLDHLDHEDPGCLKCAPYHTEHMQSLDIERLMCHQDGIEWEDYYNATPKGLNHV